MVNLQAELTYLQAHLATLELPSPPPAPPQPLYAPPPSQSMSDLPAVVPATYDLSALFDNTTMHPSWTLHQRQQQIDPRTQFSTTFARATTEAQSPAAGIGGGDLQELARELLNRHAPPAALPCRNQASAMPPHSR